MRITSVSFKTAWADGIQPVTLPQLRKQVVLAGPNGAGKTRFLERMFKIAGQVGGNSVEQIDIDQMQEKQLSGQEPLESELQVAHGWAAKHAIKVAGSGKLVAVAFNSKSIPPINSPFDAPPSRLEGTRVKAEESLGLIPLEDSFMILQAIVNQYMAHTHPEQHYEGSDETRRRFNQLNALLSKLLGTKLAWRNESATLFGRRLTEAQLSEGQRLLLQIALQLFHQDAKLSEVILFLDEPEHHLHPQTVLDVLELLYEVVSDGQVWIATHSLEVLSSIDPQDIYYVENGCVSWAGRRIEHVVSALLGNDDRQRRLADLSSMASQLAAVTFSAQCLTDPGVVESANPRDPQVTILRDAVRVGIGTLVDFGAGNARLLTALMDDGFELRGAKRYVGYEPFGDGSEPEPIRFARDAGSNVRFLTQESELRTLMADGRAGMCVLCNVWHEIPVDMWVSTASLIRDILDKDGHVLVIEDQVLPIGELPNTSGFQMLGTEQWKLALAGASIEEVVSQSGPKTEVSTVKERIHGYVIRAADFRFTKKSIRSALTSLRDASLAEVKHIRESRSTSYRAGLEHSFWTQQFANASLALEKLSDVQLD